MQTFLAIAGLLIVIVTIVDGLWTTMQLGGRSISNRLFHITGRFLSRVIPDSHTLRSLIGPLVITGIVGAWMLGLWAGWTILFLGSPEAVISASDEIPAKFWPRVYFTGFSVITLGVGDYKPGSAGYQIATVVASMTGFFLFTLAITYASPVLTAVVQARQLAGYIASLGRSPEEIILNGWNRGSFTSLEQHLVALTPMIILSSRHYLAYPVLHYFHSSRPEMSQTLNVTKLHEALLLLRWGVAAEARPDRSVTQPLHHALGELLRTVENDFVTPHDEEPPPPGLGILRAAGIPVDESGFEEALALEARRRKLFRSLLESKGWTWGDLHDGGPVAA